MVTRLVMKIVLSFICYHAFACAAQETLQSFSKLYALNGEWITQSKNGKLYESWQKVNDSTLKSKSFRVTQADTTMLEQVDLVLRRQKIFYIPVVADQNNHEPVIFTLINSAGSRYVFENLLHDFPQRVIYELPVDNALHAWIEGKTSAGFKKIDYNYKRY